MADIPVVDAHHHLWDLGRHFYPWLSPRPLPPSVAGDATPIAKNYLLEDFLADARGQNVVKSVHVEGGFDPSDPVAETRWLQEIADAHGFPHAIVAKCALDGPDVERELEAQCGFANVRGIRHMISWHDDPMKRYIDRPDLLTDPRWTKGFALLAARGLSFDLQVYPGQMRDAADLAARHGDTTVVLDHSGMPADQDPDSMAVWRHGLKRLAGLENVSIKISGLGMFDHAWSEAGIRPIVTEIIEIFGTKRCMFASNFPVDKLYSSYGTLYEAFRSITHELSMDERKDLFARNAERIYRI